MINDQYFLQKEKHENIRHLIIFYLANFFVLLRLIKISVFSYFYGKIIYNYLSTLSSGTEQQFVCEKYLIADAENLVKDKNTKMAIFIFLRGQRKSFDKKRKKKYNVMTMGCEIKLEKVGCGN